MASYLEVRVLVEMLRSPKDKHYGNALRKSLDIPSGSLYPLLMRLEAKGYLDSAFEENPRLKRGERHYYWFTSQGLDYAMETCRTLCQEVCEALSDFEKFSMEESNVG